MKSQKHNSKKTIRKVKKEMLAAAKKTNYIKADILKEKLDLLNKKLNDNKKK